MMFTRRIIPSFMILAGAILCVLAMPSGIQAQEPTAAPTVAATASATPVQQCAECHLDVVAQWQKSPHALAYNNVDFAAAWKESNDPACLSCHTTGFNAREKTYQHEGVTCEACHGQTPVQHPPQPVAISKTVDVCADCHTTTVNEWKMSAHGSQQLACTTCHLPHSQTLRMEAASTTGETTTVAAKTPEASAATTAKVTNGANTLCVNCHKEARTDFAHVKHTEQACTDCHWYRSVDRATHLKTGALLPTGHDNRVETYTCVDCHASKVTTDTGAIPQPTEAASPLEVQLRTDELEARLRTVQAQSENQGNIRLLEGVLLGSVLGGGVIAFLVRLGRAVGRNAAQKDEDEVKHE